MGVFEIDKFAEGTKAVAEACRSKQIHIRLSAAETLQQLLKNSI